MDIKTIANEFTPTGKLRAAINLGNPILANRDKVSGAPVGVSIDLATAFAERLGVTLELVVFDTAGRAVEALTANQVDIGFCAIDPTRGEGIQFTPPYVVIEGSYLVREDSPIRRNEEVDRVGNRIVVGGGSAYDLHLSRSIVNAGIVKAASSQAVVDTFIEQQAEVAAGVRQQLQADARRVPGLRLLDGRFMVINQAMATPKCRSAEAFDYLCAFVEEMKQTGFVATALEHHGISGAAVAAAGYPR